MDLLEVTNVFELIKFFCQKSDKEIVETLQNAGILKPLGRCSKCKRREILNRNSRYKGCHAAYCRTCKRFRCLTEGTFLEETRLSFKQTFMILWLWLAHVSPTDAKNIAGTTKAAGVQYFRYFRDICSYILTEHPQEQLGGPGHVVQIDKFVVSKRNYHRGRLVLEQWVLGIYDTTTKRGHVQFVVRQNSATLVPIIQAIVKPGTTIWTDEWRAYGGLDYLGYKHHMVNHSREFIAADGTCTNAVKGYWSKLKQFCRKTNVLKSSLLSEHIDEFMYREIYGGSMNERFRIFIQHIKEKYPL